ncbi:hypothetical protein P7C70_g8718, partial [Phenoliferia sp. Uapishka_3]
MLIPQLVLSIASPLSSIFNSPPHDLSASAPSYAHQPSSSRSTFSPLLPPAIPLAVKSVYLNAVLPTGGDDGSKGYLAGSWPHHWPVSYPGSDKAYHLGWSGMISVDGKAYVFLGDPEVDSKGYRPPVASQKAFHYTASTSVFAFEAGGIDFNVTFFSPVTPKDFLRQSLPLSYLSVDVDSRGLRKHNVSVYSDFSGEWASGDSNAEIEWAFGVEESIGVYEVSRKDQLLFSEYGEQAEWGSAVYATDMGPGVSTSSGQHYDIRGRFYRTGKLNGSQDVRYRAINDRQPVFGFAKTLHKTSPSIVFAIGHMRDPYVNYVTPEGQVSRRGFWSSHFPTWRHAVSFFLSDHSSAVKNAIKFDSELKSDAERVSGSNYSAIVELSTRQAFATIEITGEGDDDVLVFLKEISSNGDMSTVDVVFPMYPILTYTNPTLLKLLLEPLLIYSVSGLYNLFGDRVLNLGLFDQQLYEWQNDWYWNKRERFGVPLDSRHLWTKTDWEVCQGFRMLPTVNDFIFLQCFAAASATDVRTRDMFMDSLVAFLEAGKVDAAFPE